MEAPPLRSCCHGDALMSEPGTVFIVDDDEAVLDALQSFLRSQGLDVVGFPTAEEFLEAIPPERPGVLVVDVRMPGMSGLDLLQHTAAGGLARPCIVLSGQADIPIAVRAMQLGAQTFLEKPVPHQELLDAVRQACDRERRRGNSQADRQFAEAALRRLTSDELDVLREVAGGRTNAQVADLLDVSLRTVQFRLSNIYDKLGVRCKSELMQLLRRIDWKPPNAG
jgi:FixJ family two-component response regulator